MRLLWWFELLQGYNMAIVYGQMHSNLFRNIALLFTLSINYVNPFEIPNLTVSMIQYFVVMGVYCMFLMVCFFLFCSRLDSQYI